MLQKKRRLARFLVGVSDSGLEPCTALRSAAVTATISRLFCFHARSLALFLSLFTFSQIWERKRTPQEGGACSVFPEFCSVLVPFLFRPYFTGLVPSFFLVPFLFRFLVPSFFLVPFLFRNVSVIF